MLIFKSSTICEVGFFEDYFGEEATADVVEDVSCSLDTGSRLAIAATVLYFVCSCLIPGAVAPIPIGYNRAGQGDTQEEGAPPAAAPEKQGEGTEEGVTADKEYHA